MINAIHGHARGHTDGHARGHTDSHARGHTDGHARGHTDGHARTQMADGRWQRRGWIVFSNPLR
jgi:hypothetical protein